MEIEQMKTSIKKLTLVFIASSYFVFFGNANAVNWLQLQGVTEEPYPLVWGFLQPSFIQTSGTKLSVGPWQGQQALNNVVQPDLSSSQVFQLQRARVGIRGAVADSDKISYFLLAEYGNNGITQPGGGAGRVTLTDATVTFSQIEGAKIRVGQMKIPMSEEVFQGIMAFNYINLSNIANQQLIERPLWTDGNAPCMITSNPLPAPAPQLSDPLYLQFCNGDSQTQFRSASVAARDTGILVFDSFLSGGWEHSYGILIGQGGANKDDRDNHLDNTIYLASEKIFKGMKIFREGLKLYAWRTSGKRTLYDSAILNAGGTSLEAAERDYDRKLTGIGGTYFDGKYRFWAEYIKADGMIFNGSTGGAVPGSVNGVGPMPPTIPFPSGAVVAQFKTEPEGEADGGYLDFGYRIKPNIELDVRYDWYNRVTNMDSADELKFVTWTLGAQYFFSSSAKLIVNYEKRSVEAPGLPSSDPVNQIADDTDDRISAQVFVLF